ncbi:MAG: hypothetical protein KF861_09290 [Planctomycetaceae bacterium]|nr:hypothetical protein [Planctomycetaceae bacterium]
MPAVGAGIGAGAALGNRVGERPSTLPGLGDRRPGASQLPADRTPQQRRDALQDRLSGESRLDGAERPGQLPNRDWDQVRNDWQQNRDDIREDWQQHRDEARNDWQNWFDDHYGWYGGWYGGYAPGYWGRWDYLWDNYPVAAAVGLTWWGVNALSYGFGYSDYVNPYYTESMSYDYSQPVITMPVETAYAASAATPAATSELPPGVSQNAIDTFDQARRQFLAGQYEQALQLTDSAIREMPRDAVLHEFRSLVLFALQRYSESAAAIHAVLDVGPGWDWKTLSELYPSTDIYTTQLRALEQACESAPDAADQFFLLGYHYLTCGHQEAAIRMFRRASELQPKDTVAAALVASLSPRETQSSPPTAASDTPKPVPSTDVVGAWTASGPDSSTFSMTLREDGTFTWLFERGVRKQKSDGVYTVEGNVLAMEPDSGGVMLAELTLKGTNDLHFKMVGGVNDDPGLDFRRTATR